MSSTWAHKLQDSLPRRFPDNKTCYMYHTLDWVFSTERWAEICDSKIALPTRHCYPGRARTQRQNLACSSEKLTRQTRMYNDTAGLSYIEWNTKHYWIWKDLAQKSLGQNARAMYILRSHRGSAKAKHTLLANPYSVMTNYHLLVSPEPCLLCCHF